MNRNGYIILKKSIFLLILQGIIILTCLIALINRNGGALQPLEISGKICQEKIYQIMEDQWTLIAHNLDRLSDECAYLTGFAKDDEKMQIVFKRDHCFCSQ